MKDKIEELSSALKTAAEGLGDSDSKALVNGCKTVGKMLSSLSSAEGEKKASLLAGLVRTTKQLIGQVKGEAKLTSPLRKVKAALVSIMKETASELSSKE